MKWKKRTPILILLLAAALVAAPVSAEIRAVNDAVEIDAGAWSVAIYPLANDVSDEGDLWICQVINGPDHGLITKYDTSIEYTPDDKFFGLDTIEYGIAVKEGADPNDPCATATITITVLNKYPRAVDDSATTLVNTAVTINVLANDYDDDGDQISVTNVYVPSHGVCDLLEDDTIRYTPENDYTGVDSFDYSIEDEHGANHFATVRITVVEAVNNHPSAVSDWVTTPENTAVTINVLANDTDEDGDQISVTSVAQPSHGVCVVLEDDTIRYTPDMDYSGDDSFEYFIEDEHGAGDSAAVWITVAEAVNHAPTDAVIVTPGIPISVTSPCSAMVTFVDEDLGAGDSHTVIWEWGDGSLPVTVPAVGNCCDCAHAYESPGVYQVRVTVTDAVGAECQAISDYIVVYDPNGGFVTGGGWFWSLPGAYVADPELEGKATFGFVSRYLKKAEVPTGNTEFHFQVADLNFHSDAYDWLVVAGTKAMFKGAGTINGEGPYKFMISAIDGDPDLFRIKIWSENVVSMTGAIDAVEEIVIYDNQILNDGIDAPLSGDNAEPVTVILGGSIVVKKK